MPQSNTFEMASQLNAGQRPDADVIVDGGPSDSTAAPILWRETLRNWRPLRTDAA